MGRNSFIQAAFEAVCKEAKPAEGSYVVLMESIRRYLGPWEGGTWGNDEVIVAYHWFPTEEEAEAARKEVEKLARELSEESRKEFGERCLREMEWCEARGLDADYLPEPDGDSEFFVVVSEGLPQEYHAPRHYE